MLRKYPLSLPGSLSTIPCHQPIGMQGTVVAVIIFLVTCCLQGCAVTEDFKPPVVSSPDGWRTTLPTNLEASEKKWWEQFQDPVLNDLITAALRNNHYLKIAVARVDEMQGRLRSTTALKYPQLGYDARASRQQKSGNGDLTVIGGDRISSNYLLQLPVSWELDLWGRIARSTEEARAQLLSAAENRKAVVMSLTTDVALNYINLLTLVKKLEVSRDTLKSRKELLDVYLIKKEKGQISNLELAQVLSSYEEIKVLIPEIEYQISIQENYLSLLCGFNPGRIPRGRSLESLGTPDVPAGLPSDLLSRRPDIRQKEQDLVAANARIGIARTKYFPSISLTGLLGYVSKELSELLTGSSNVWSIGSDIAGSLFTGGKISGELQQAHAVYRQVLNDYMWTVQTAFREVNDSLIYLQKQKEQYTELQRYIAVLKDYENFSRIRYETGYLRYLTVLDAQRRLYSAEIKHVQTASNIYAALIKLYKAMGGGWVGLADEMVEK
ncbi:membrane protein [Desulfolithobacter dissulfuricans]|uniref:Membrane protein n=1 Tax=Desulfolithobacter dissulfuricans TaxID=2795293 RepID=A0A915XGW2_9BACT|nr:efflux transporter outer membrane subunit [Desulfolithobacter dissulfuricans]BCO07924.1 membrane protein [Desulfolithobacter dissulfuricans]